MKVPSRHILVPGCSGLAAFNFTEGKTYKQPPQPWPQASIPSTHRETVHVDAAVVVDVVTVVGGQGGLEKVGVLGPPHSGASLQH